MQRVRRTLCGLVAVGAMTAMAFALASITAASTVRSHDAGSALAKVIRIGHPNIPVPGSARPPVDGTTAAGSYNWAGYVDASSTVGTYKSVVGHWTVPAVTCTPEDRLEASWVGIDGATNSTVEQLGTLSQCYKGVPVYQSWYEMYPAAGVTVGKTVKAGDHITAEVLRSGTSYTLKLIDVTTAGNNISVVKSCAATVCKDQSAEWIVERPAYAIGITPLAQFTSTPMTTDSVNGAALSAPTYSFTMIDATGAYKLASPTAVSNAGFSVKWLNSY